VEAAILTENLTKRFGARTAVNEVSLEVPAGEVFGFLGPNGAGKTTTIAMLLGLVRPDAGRAALLGHDVTREPVAALRHVGALVEEPAFYPYLSGRDNLRVLARASGVPVRRVEEVLALVELGDRGRDRFRTYSQGMRQRLGIAAALLHEPRLIIVDEPTRGLDPAGQHGIHTLIRSLASQGRTVFFSSHTLAEVETLCEQVAILMEGRLIAQGRVADLLRRGHGLFLRVAGEPGRAAALLRTVAWVADVAREGEALLVDAPTERAPELNALLISNGVPVLEMRTNERHLEELFLELTKSPPPPLAPMLNLIRAEWLKLTRRPLTWALLATCLGLLALQLAVQALAVILDSAGLLGHEVFQPAQLEEYRRRVVFPGVIGAVFGHLNGLGGAFTVILAAGAMGSEYGWGTLRTQLARTPDRTAYLLAKLAALLLVLAAGMLITLVFGLTLGWATSGLLAASAGPSPAALEALPVALLRALYVQLPYVLLTFCFAIVGRSLLVGVAGGLIYLVFEAGFGALTIFAVLGGPWRTLYNLTIGRNIDTLTLLNSHTFGLRPETLTATMPPDGAPTALQAILVVAAYCALFLATALHRLVREDVTGAA
jgi:ABC-2 type transport system ATP-binding protein